MPWPASSKPAGTGPPVPNPHRGATERECNTKWLAAVASLSASVGPPRILSAMRLCRRGARQGEPARPIGSRRGPPAGSPCIPLPETRPAAPAPAFEGRPPGCGSLQMQVGRSTLTPLWKRAHARPPERGPAGSRRDPPSRGGAAQTGRFGPPTTRRRRAEATQQVGPTRQATSRAIPPPLAERPDILHRTSQISRRTGASPQHGQVSHEFAMALLGEVVLQDGGDHRADAAGLGLGLKLFPQRPGQTERHLFPLRLGLRLQRHHLLTCATNITLPATHETAGGAFSWLRGSRCGSSRWRSAPTTPALARLRPGSAQCEQLVAVPRDCRGRPVWPGPPPWPILQGTDAGQRPPLETAGMLAASGVF